MEGRTSQRAYDPQTLRDVRDALCAAGHVPLVTDDSSELGTLIATERPKLVLLDVVLPGTDGIEPMEQVRELADVPVIPNLGLRR